MRSAGRWDVLGILLAIVVIAGPVAARPLLPASAFGNGDGAMTVTLDPAPALPDSGGVAAGRLVQLPPGTAAVEVSALEIETAAGLRTAPAAWVRVGELMILRGTPVVPISLDPASLAGAGGGPVTAARVSLNAIGAPKLRAEADAAESSNRGVYLIIAADGLVDALAPLVTWKTRAGFDVRVHPVSAIGATRDAIRAFVRDAYRTWDDPPRYLLLVGDVETIPTWLMSGNVTDHPYACVDGDDFAPDVLVGRFSAKTPAEVDVQVAKTLGYESAPDTTGGDPWFRRALMAAGNLNSSTPVSVCRWAAAELQRAGFIAPDSAYKSNSPSHPWWEGKLIIKYFVDRGVSVVNYRGWAYGDVGWQPPTFTNEHVPTLANGWKLPVVFSIVCHTGNFGNAEIDCFGEAWMKAGTPAEPKGAVAFVGTGEHWSHSRWNDRVDMGVVNAITHQDLRELGAILASAKLALLPQFPTEVRMSEVSDPEQSVEYYSHVYNLLGDPSLELRTEVPRVVRVNHAPSADLGANVVEIEVREADGATAVAGARAALEQNGRLVGYGVSDYTGVARVRLAAGSIDPITVTVTGRGLYPAQSVLGVVAQEASLTCVAAEPAGGQRALPGGEVDVTLRLRNSGTTGINEATVTAEAPPPIEVLVGSAALGAVAPGATGATLTPLRLRLPADLEDGRRIWLSVTPEVPGAGALGATEAALTVTAPALTCVAAGGGDGVFDRGETSDLIVTLRNDGSAGGGALQARLRAHGVPGWVTLVDPLAAMPEILPGAEASNAGDPFRIQIADSVAVGTVIPMSLEVLYNDGPQQVVPLSLVVGEIDASSPTGPDAHGYYAYDSADRDYPDQAPVYRWVECSPTYGGAGTHLDLEDNLGGALIELPFTFRYYGVPHDTIRVSDNGWISFDTAWWYDIRNWSLPDAWGGACQVAPFWDNLDPGLGGADGVYAWYDEAEHRMVVEWSRMRNYETDPEGSSGCDDAQTFQVLLCDPAFHRTPTDDGEIVFQYKQIVNDDWARMYSTVGMEDHSEAVGLLYSYGNRYAPGAAPLSPGLAIRITTAPPFYRPPTVVAGALGPRLRLLGSSVSTGETRLLLDSAGAGGDELGVFDATGRRVRTLRGDPAGPGPRTVLWDGRDAEGRRVPSGLYWFRLRAGGVTPGARVLVVR